MSNTLKPFVYWAQTESQVTLKVDLTDVKDLNVNLKETTLQVTAYGQGARGMNSYSFDLSLHSPIDPNESSYKVIDREVDFTLRKKHNGWWPRLTSQPQKPSWLKIDFDKWKSEDMDNNEDEKRDILSDYPDMYDKLHKVEFGYKKEDFTKVYLFIYNVCQFVGFIFALAVMAIIYSRDGPESLQETYSILGKPLMTMQILQCVEIITPFFGHSKNNAMMAFLQISSRMFMLFFIESEPRTQSSPHVFFMLIIWSTLDIIKYPYYSAQMLNIEVPFLTWLHHTIWIPSYPMAFICEYLIIKRSIPYFEETQKFSISLPNSYNIAFDFPTFIRLYLLFYCLPGMCIQMLHMGRQLYRKLEFRKLIKTN